MRLFNDRLRTGTIILAQKVRLDNLKTPWLKIKAHGKCTSLDSRSAKRRPNQTQRPGCTGQHQSTHVSQTVCGDGVTKPTILLLVSMGGLGLFPLSFGSRGLIGAETSGPASSTVPGKRHIASSCTIESSLITTTSAYLQHTTLSINLFHLKSSLAPLHAGRSRS